jgi:hypothetical protein
MPMISKTFKDIKTHQGLRDFLKNMVNYFKEKGSDDFKGKPEIDVVKSIQFEEQKADAPN